MKRVGLDVLVIGKCIDCEPLGTLATMDATQGSITLLESATISK